MEVPICVYLPINAMDNLLVEEQDHRVASVNNPAALMASLLGVPPQDDTVLMVHILSKGREYLTHLAKEELLHGETVTLEEVEHGNM